MKTKISLITILCLLVLKTNAQIEVQVNGKPIKQNQEIKYDDQLKTINISFSNPKQIPEYTTGKVEFFAKITNEKGEYIDGYMITKNGYSALSDFLYTKSPVSFVLLDEAAESNSFGGVGKSFLNQCSRRVDDLSARTIKVTVSLTFYEKVTYDSYGSPIKLNDDFVFTVDIWKNSATIAFKSLGAKLTFANVPEYKGIKAKNDWNDVDKGQFGAQGFGTGEVLILDLGEHVAYARVIERSGKTQDEILNEYKTSFENYLMVVSNGCNSNSIKESLPALDEKDWEKFSGYMKQYVGMGSYDKFQTIYQPLDQLNNPAWASVKVFEEITVGVIQGYRFKGLIHSAKCVSRGFFFIGAKQGSRIEQSENIITGDLVMYLLKHPTNKNQMIVVASPSAENQTTQESVESKAKLVEKFLTNLTF